MNPIGEVVRGGMGQTLVVPSPRLHNLMEVMKADGHFKIFTAALEDLGLDEVLRTSGPFTVFAPTDEAFEHVPKLAKLLENTADLRSTLTRHIVWGYLDLQALGGIQKLSPIKGESIRIQRTKVRVADADVVHANLQAPNGIIHAVSRVFTPGNYSALREIGLTVEDAFRAGASKLLEIGEGIGKWIHGALQRAQKRGD